MQVDLVKLATEVVAVSSFAHTVLPPWEALADFPSAQKYYKLFIYLVGYLALNGRSTLYSNLSTKDGSQPSATVLKSNGDVSRTISIPGDGNAQIEVHKVSKEGK